MTTTTFPNGQVFISSALTVLQMNTIMQALATQMLGIAPGASNFDSMVRLDWPTGGQPSYQITDDLCFLRNIVVDDQYNRIRDKTETVNDGITLLETWNYTRVWMTSFTVVGPNSSDNARLIKSAFFLDFPLDSLAQSNLYLLADIADPIRAPELFAGQWWERCDLEVKFNEAVTETIYTPAIATSEILIGDEFGNSTVVNL